MSQLLLSWRGNFCYSPSAHYQVCWTFLRSSWCWAVPDEMSSLPCHITNASSSLERVTEQKLAVSWSRSCCISHVFSFWIKPTPVRIPLAPQSPALEMRVWGMRHFSAAKEPQQPLPFLVWICESENLIPIIVTFWFIVWKANQLVKDSVAQAHGDMRV